MPFVRVRPTDECVFTAYHGTYTARAGAIEREGLRPGRDGHVWLAASAAGAWEHIASRRIGQGCPDEPITVLKVRVHAGASCPVFRPVRPGAAKVYITPVAIPSVQVLERTPVNKAAITRGKKRGRPTKPAASCPPKVP